MAERPPFHLAVPVDDLAAARAFYVEALGCGVGREDARWVDLDLHGHQVVLHEVEGARARRGVLTLKPVRSASGRRGAGHLFMNRLTRQRSRRQRLLQSDRSHTERAERDVRTHQARLYL